jgi:hypothetical protein
MTGGMFKMATMTNVLATSDVTVGTNKLPYNGSAAFAKTTTWTEEYAFAGAENTFSTKTTVFTIADAKRQTPNTLVAATTAGLTAKPTHQAAAYQTNYF